MVPRRTILVLLLPFLLQSADAVVGADVHGPAPMTASAFQSALHVPEARLTNISSNATHTLFVWRPKRETLRPAPILRSPSMDDLWAPLLHDVSAYGESKPGTCYQKSHSTSFADSFDLVLPFLTFSGALLTMLILDLVLPACNISRTQNVFNDGSPWLHQLVRVLGLVVSTLFALPCLAVVFMCDSVRWYNQAHKTLCKITGTIAALCTGSVPCASLRCHR